jgi:hypothetical protein
LSRSKDAQTWVQVLYREQTISFVDGFHAHTSAQKSL